MNLRHVLAGILAHNQAKHAEMFGPGDLGEGTGNMTGGMPNVPQPINPGPGDLGIGTGNMTGGMPNVPSALTNAGPGNLGEGTGNMTGGMPNTMPSQTAAVPPVTPAAPPAPVVPPAPPAQQIDKVVPPAPIAGPDQGASPVVPKIARARFMNVVVKEPAKVAKAKLAQVDTRDRINAFETAFAFACSQYGLEPHEAELMYKKAMQKVSAQNTSVQGGGTVAAAPTGAVSKAPKLPANKIQDTRSTAPGSGNPPTSLGQVTKIDKGGAITGAEPEDWFAKQMAKRQ